MSPSDTASERPSPLRIVGELLFRNWGLKAIALVLAAIMFVSTRDEVTRVFTVPLKVVEDPDRVLLTELPETIQVQARGPWTRINRLQDYDFGVATLNLEDAGPGPLEVDRAAIVMPSGVVLAGIQYDHVDLRFDEVVEPEIVVEPVVEGVPAPDYELVRVEVTPTRWRVRGGESFVRKVETLSTEPLDLEGADHDVEVRRALQVPPEGVVLVGADVQEPMVTVRAIINARQETRRIVVPVVVPQGLDPTGVIPRTYEVRLQGPVPDFRVLDGLVGSIPVQTTVTKVEGEGAGGGVVEVRFGWAEGVPQDLRERLEFEHATERIELPTPPPPPPTLDQPDP
ncbi:CdaR family protein [Paraliomyxa miuraensis]|uniref:CdaR family protein n=1 Tax=Paraliomyxa miuraensis TaxID=376150 RepID=UPI0022575E9C|nr:CdaR family protein [Paraliomyxa miuraensis]MCX4244604.1 CdaR family protein [Paraliomyxa miuraensis]